jgi:hypothetical protein
MANNLSVRPVEEFVFQGLAKRFQQVFDCICVYTNTYETMRAVQQIFDGKPVQYPFAIMRIDGMRMTENTWNTQQMARKGLITSIQDDGKNAWAVKLMPATFTIGIEYHTNQFDLSLNNSVLAFAKSWIFARRNGFLKYEVQYGNLALQILPQLDNDLQIPSMDNQANKEAVFVVKANIQLLGWISQAHLGTENLVKEINVGVTVSEPAPSPQGTVISQSFWPIGGISEV